MGQPLPYSSTDTDINGLYIDFVNFFLLFTFVNIFGFHAVKKELCKGVIMMNTILEIHPKELKFICKFIIGRWPALIIF